jgi:hypothetical protein
MRLSPQPFVSSTRLSNTSSEPPFPELRTLDETDRLIDATG